MPDSASDPSIDAESGAVRGPLASSNGQTMAYYSPQFAPDGASLLLTRSLGAAFLQDYGTGRRREFPGATILSSDDLFAVQVSKPAAGANPRISRVLNLRTGESWGSIQGGGVF
jgi:hypothetical protein